MHVHKDFSSNAEVTGINTVLYLDKQNYDEYLDEMKN